MTESKLPAGWTAASLESLTVPKVQQAEPGATEVPYIDISAIDRDTKRIGETERVSRETAPTRARQWVRSGDVLVSMTRPNLNAVAMVPPALDGAVASTGFDVLRAIEVLPDWIFNRVRTNEFVADVCKGLQGVVYPAIRPRDVRGHQIPVPPLREQRRIVAALDSHMTRLDDAIAGLERVQRNLNRYRASVLQAAVEGRLVPSEAELARAEGRDYEPASVLLERILAERRRRWEEAESAKRAATGKPARDDRWKSKYPEPMAPDLGVLPVLPDGWTWATLDQVASEIRNGCSVAPHETSGVPILRISAVRKMEVDITDVRYLPPPVDQYEDSRLRAGDLLFTRYNGSRPLVGVCGLLPQFSGDLIHPDKLIRVRLVGNGASEHYLQIASNSGVSRAHIERRIRTTAGQHGVSGGDLRSLPIPLPPLQEQVRLAQEVDRCFSVELQADAAVRLNSNRCNRLRQCILGWAFEGRLVDQDAHDEPAAPLLERIQKSREATPDEARPARGRGRRRVRS